MSDQNHKHNTQDIFNSTRRGLILPVVAISILSLTIITGLAAFSVRSLDSVSEQKSVHLAKSVLGDIENKLMDLNFDYAYWDQAVDNLVNAYDPEWADENVGAYLYETYGVSSVYVIDEADKLVYGAMEGEQIIDAPLSRFSGGLHALLAQARAVTPLDVPPRSVGGFVRQQDRLFFASAARLTTYWTVDGENIDQGTGSVLVLMKEMSADQLALLAERYLLQNLRLELSPAAQIGMTSLVVTDVNGKRLGAFHWDTDLPGTAVLTWLLPAAGILFLVLGGLIIISIRRATAASQAFITALTGRYEAEWERQRGQIQKMQALGIMVGGVAHNFNNLLQPILMLALTMRKRTAQDSQDRADFNVIVHACERAKDLVKQISDFTRDKEEHEHQEQNVYEVVNEGCELVASTIPTSITLIKNLDENTGVVRMDAIETQTVLMNLISNAIDAMAGHVGELTIGLSPVTIDDEAAVLLPHIKSGAYAKLTVSDTGVGMDQETLARAFDPFFTTKNVGDGTGLGLSSAYGIVTRHGGAMHASSDPGRGSTFDVFLPLIGDDESAVPNG